jgi:transcriptional regulator with XRE-family HTH domain
MGREKIDDRELARLIDSGLTQAQVARRFGVSRAAVCQRLRELRGKTTRAIVSKKVLTVVDKKIDAIAQLLAINEKANQMLDEAESDPDLRLKVMAEIRGQLRLQLEIYQTMFDLKAVQEFMDETMAVIGQVEPEIRREIIRRLNERKSIRSALHFT